MDIKPPSGKELFKLRVMILLGLAAMCFFLYSVLSVAMDEYNFLYWLLIASFIFTCLKILHEWCHYLYIIVPETPPPGKEFTVDIFTTFCAGEPYEMIIETLTAIQAITYPHKTYLCDEADDPYLRDFCKRMGINHVTRTEKKNAKAGNINNALQHSSGELCVVLDPDHVPQPNFLDPIVSHFNDPKIGFVQVVQAYKNSYEGLIAKGAAQQTYQFYGPMMMTMNKYGTVLAIGANCTFRRAALDSIGGHAAGLAEDMHTSMQLHAKGWKSVYVPAVLARGLVPSTLSAYYKQQLKWSRGVFELLVTAYPKLFTKFTWKQKLHYGVIPLHYFSGVIFLINFIIPILSLFFDISPIHMSPSHFGLVVFPFVVATILIRHFVQWWVMEDKERGFHIVGGLLMIGTWWIFILGFVYTILRRKVPYVPTPKDGNEANNWPLNIPNLVVISLSLAAIIYGLWVDWSPYNLFMSGFAATNCLFMTFTILASRQQQFSLLTKRYKRLDALMSLLNRHKNNLWLFRRRVYAGVRSTALMTTILLTCVIIYFTTFKSYSPYIPPQKQHKNEFFLTGISLAEKSNQYASLALMNQRQNRSSLDIISFVIPWGNGHESYLPFKKIEAIYRNGSLPMISWEPYRTLVNSSINASSTRREENVFQHISRGDYDEYLHFFVRQIKLLHRPVYICFAPESDNLSYPWSASGKSTANDFKAAWQYVHHYFLENGAYNAIWVWNPAKASVVTTYFPGKQYVDWLSVSDGLSDSLTTGIHSTSLEAAYAPFHQTAVFRSGLPVMLTHVSRPSTGNKSEGWLQPAFKSAKQIYPEIRGFILSTNTSERAIDEFNLSHLLVDNNQQPVSARHLLKIKQQEELGRPATPILVSLSQYNSEVVPSVSTKPTALAGVVGMNYTKAANWKKSYQAFTKRELIADVKEMHQMGINTLKHIGPSVYDHNLLGVTQQLGLNLHYEYWIPDAINFVTDKKELEKLRKTILSSVDDLKPNRNIIAWHIGNTALQDLDFFYYKPDLLYQQDACLEWLKRLVHDIKTIDPDRPVTIDINVSDDMPELVERIHTFIPEIDAYGLILTKHSTGSARVKEVNAPYFYSQIDVPDYTSLASRKAGAYITNWQDEKSLDQVTFDGIKDYWGRTKFSFLQLQSMHKGKLLPDSMPQIKILRPALGTFPYAQLTYHTLIRKQQQWFFTNTVPNDLQFEWKLVKTDMYGIPIAMKDLGRGASMTVTIPDSPLDHRLYVYVMKGNCVVKIIGSTLNTPLPMAAMN
jgi:cellulose synthase (UDP-forming)